MVSTGRRRRIELGLLVILILSITEAESSCSRTCDLALGSYYVWRESNLTFITEVFESDFDTILKYNPEVPNKDSVKVDTRLNVPFSCGCVKSMTQDEFLGHTFDYSVRPGDTYQKVANTYYSNLTNYELLRSFNTYDPNNIPDVGSRLNVTVNCYCGDENVSKDYGLFITYPLRPGETLNSVASEFSLSSDLLQQYNPNSDFSRGSGLVYIPGKDENGNYPKLNVS